MTGPREAVSEQVRGEHAAMSEHRGLDGNGEMRSCIQDRHFCWGFEPSYDEDGVQLYQGDVLAVLADLPDESVDCVVTSPPYWSLRKYSGEGTVWGGDPECAHEFSMERVEGRNNKHTMKWTTGGNPAPLLSTLPDDALSTHGFCRCGAWRGQYGLELDPALYVEHSIMVLRVIRRVLKRSGIVFLNLGDSYYGGGRGGGGSYASERRNWDGLPYGSDGKEPEGYRGDGSSLTYPDGECPKCGKAERSKSHNGSQRGHVSSAYDGDPILERKASPSPSLDNSDSARQKRTRRSGRAKRDQRQTSIPAPSPLPDAQASTRHVFAQESQDDPEDLSCSCSRSLRRRSSRGPRSSVDTESNLDIDDIEQRSLASGDHTAGRDRCVGAYSSIPYLKPKDLVLIPWRVGLAAQADGWWLRSDIIWSKPNPMPESVTDRPTKSHEYVLMLAKGQWSARAVQFADLPSDLGHLRSHSGGANPHMRATGFCVRLATALFDLAQRESEFSLPPLDAQIWQELPEGGDGDFVRSLPAVQRPAALAARYLTMRSSAQSFMQELNRLGCDLSDGNHLLVGGLKSLHALSPSVYRNADGTITVDDAGQVCQVDFLHNRIVVPTATTCNYYFDADAVREPQSEGTFARFGNGAAPRKTTAKAYAADAGEVRTNASFKDATPEAILPNGRNIRSVWNIATQPSPLPHFASFPEELAERCIKAGCPADGIVLDPFGGTGTTLKVARDLGRRAIGIEISPEYVELAVKRLRYGIRGVQAIERGQGTMLMPTRDDADARRDAASPEPSPVATG